VNFCNNVMPRLIANNITIPRELQNDCDAGDRGSIANATAEQSMFILLRFFLTPSLS
jgi:hypothetical protein